MVNLLTQRNGTRNAFLQNRAKIRTDTIRVIFDFSSVFKTLFFSAGNFKPHSIFVLGHQEQLNGLFCIIFFFHARPMRPVRLSGETVRKSQNHVLFKTSAGKGVFIAWKKNHHLLQYANFISDYTCAIATCTHNGLK